MIVLTGSKVQAKRFSALVKYREEPGFFIVVFDKVSYVRLG